MVKTSNIAKVFGVLILGLFLISFASASIIFSVQPHSVYNMGDKVNTAIKITPEPRFDNVISVSMNCDSGDLEVYKEFLSLTLEMDKSLIIPLIDSLIGNSSGSCVFDVRVGGDVEVSSESFRISNIIKVELLNWGNSYNSGEQIRIEGSAIKETGKNVEGSYSISIGEESFVGEVVGGEFGILFNIPDNFPSGLHQVNLSVEERDANEKVINYGNRISFLNINQVPTSIEVVLDETEVFPGGSIRGKVVLHDQTGDSIHNREVYVAIKDESGEIVKKIITRTEQEFEYPIEGGQMPAVFEVSTYSEDLINEVEVTVPENREIRSEILNRTLILTNIGNVFYEGEVMLKIGEDEVVIVLSLPVGESEEYLISAPDGEYDVVVGGVTKRMSLSGNAVQVKKVTPGFTSLSSFIWIFALMLVAVGAFLVFRKGHRPSVFARMGKAKEEPKSIEKLHGSEKTTGDVFDSKKKVELSLSITGAKQRSSVGCISLKNYEEINSGRGNVRETFSEIKNLIEERKGLFYPNKGHFFFILAPSFTKTFKNPKPGISLSKEIIKVLEDHNRKFKQKIDFGISLSHGEIIIKVEPKSIKFMSLGNLMASCKKLSNYSKGELVVSENIKKELGSTMKGKKVEVGSSKAYELEGMVDKDNHSTFIKGFVARQERDRLAKANKKKEKK